MKQPIRRRDSSHGSVPAKQTNSNNPPKARWCLRATKSLTRKNRFRRLGCYAERILSEST
jgi:hypothetical protein